MKNFLSKITNKFKGKLKVQIPAGSTVISPHKHWRALLISFFVMILVLIVFSFYLLFEIKKGEIYHNDAVLKNRADPINEKLLDKVTKTFNEKADKEKSLIANPPVYGNPSL